MEDLPSVPWHCKAARCVWSFDMSRPTASPLKQYFYVLEATDIEARPIKRAWWTGDKWSHVMDDAMSWSTKAAAIHAMLALNLRNKWVKVKEITI